MNFLDKAIGYVSPAAAIKRAAQRKAFSMLYEGGRQSQNRVHIYYTAGDAKQDNDPYTRHRQLELARYICANLGSVRASVDDLVRYSLGPKGLCPQSLSKNEAWGNEAEEYFEQWSKIADAGGRFTFGDLQRIGLRSAIRDGDCGFILTKTPNGFAKLQAVEAHQFGGSKDGKFEDGVKLSFGVPVAYLVGKGENAVEVDAANFIHLFEPDRSTGVRGVTWLHSGINNALDVFDLLGYEKAFLHNASALTLIETNEDGAADIGASYLAGARTNAAITANASAVSNDLQLEKRSAGEIRYIKPTGKIEAFQFQRPSSNFRDFLDYIESDVLLGLGLPANWKNLHKEGGATLRAALVKAQRRFDEVQELVASRICNRVWFWVIASAANRKEIPPLPADAWRVRWHGPSKATVDNGRDSKANIEDIKLGTRTISEDYAERGLDWQAELRQRAKEEAYLDALAQEYGVDIGRITQRSPNPPPEPVEPAGKETPDESKD